MIAFGQHADILNASGSSEKLFGCMAMTDKAIINVGDVSRPATVLIQKISSAAGGLFKPYQITRVARAEAEAELIRVENQIQVTDLQRRAMHRFIGEEAKKQENMERIAQKSLPLLDEQSSPENVEDDWITNFFDKSRSVSDEQMQDLWSKVLAGEANSPGAFSRKTVNLIADLDKRDAELFTRLCAYAWVIGNVHPLVFDVHEEIYSRNGIHFGSLIHLESLGLIQFNHLTTFERQGLPKKCLVYYHERPLELTMPKDENNKMDLGHVLLTQAGQQLAPICGSARLDDFFQFVRERWTARSYVMRDLADDAQTQGQVTGLDPT